MGPAQRPAKWSPSRFSGPPTPPLQPPSRERGIVALRLSLSIASLTSTAQQWQKQTLFLNMQENQSVLFSFALKFGLICDTTITL